MTLREAYQEQITLKPQQQESVEIRHGSVSHHVETKKQPFLSIVIPLYNEEKSIGKVIKNIPNHRPQEILVVNDGSTDKSIEEVKKLNHEKVRIIHHKHNLGYGAAILTGIRKAKGDIIVTLDSDGQHDPKEIPKLIRPIEKNQTDLVIGSRYLGKCLYDVPLHTRAGEFIIKKVLKVIFGQPIKNNQSGFRAFNNKIKYCMDKIRFKGMGFTTELLFRSGIHNLKFKEVPIKVKKRYYGTSYVYLPKLVKSIFMCILFYSVLNFFSKIFKYFI